MSFTIVVVTWESGPDLRRLVDSMNRNLSGSEELIVVDNDSRELPLGEAERWKGEGWLLSLDANHGFGAAANAGVDAAAHPGVAILNADTELLDGGLGSLVAMALDEGCIAGPRVLEADRSLQPSASGPAVGAWPWLRALVPAAMQPAPLLARTSPWRLQRRTPVSWLTGCAVAGPAERLRALGPFDPAIHLYAEDLDLGLRARDAGLPSVFAPELCRLVHYGKGSTAQRYEDLGRGLVADNGRAVLSRRYGERRERRAFRAELLNLRLRVAAKRLLRRPRDHDEMTLSALRDSQPSPSANAEGPPAAAVHEKHRLGGGAII